ncbi:MAG: YqhA family protein [Thiohalocapsa sp.]
MRRGIAIREAVPPHFNVNAVLRGMLTVSRCSMLPLAAGLLVALAIVLVQFFRELWHALTGFAGMSDGDVMIAVLKLVDLALIAHLAVMIVGAAIEAVLPAADRSNPETAGAGVGFGVIKLRLFASISAIAAIYLLERFINVHALDKTDVLWEILILVSFVVSGILLAGMDRLSAERH